MSTRQIQVTLTMTEWVYVLAGLTALADLHRARDEILATRTDVLKQLV